MTLHVSLLHDSNVHLIFIIVQNETERSFADRVHEIIRRDSSKDPATNPHALLAKILVDQVILSFPALMFELSICLNNYKSLMENKSSPQIMKLDEG